MAKRLMRIALKNGNVILGLDDYEIPPKLLDFTWIENIKFDSIPGRYDLIFKLRNILDGKTTWVQGNNITLKYKTGRSFSLSFSANF